MVHSHARRSVQRTKKRAPRSRRRIVSTPTHGSLLRKETAVVHATRPKVHDDALPLSRSPLPLFVVLVESKCRVEVLPDEYIRAGQCVSLLRLPREQCAGGCESQASNVLTLANVTYQMGNSTCECCAPKETYTETVSMECKVVGVVSYFASATYTRIRACACQVCKG